MNQENQPDELPDYLRDSQNDQDSSLAAEEDAATAWAAAFAAGNNPETAQPEAPEANISDNEVQEAPQVASPAPASQDAAQVAPQDSPQVAPAETEPAFEESPAQNAQFDDVDNTQAWSTFLSEESTNQEPAAIPESSRPDAAAQPAPEEPADANAAVSTTSPYTAKTDAAGGDEPGNEPVNEPSNQPENETETTMVRRKSLLDGAATNMDILEPEEEVEPQWQPREAKLLGKDDAALAEGNVLAGATVKPGPISRAGAHAMSLLLSVFLLPFAWAFLKHASGLLFSAEKSAWNTGHYSIEGLIFLVLGLAVIVVVGIAVRLSSLGMFVGGILLSVVGLVFVTLPFVMKDLVEPTLTWLSHSTLLPLKLLSYFIESSAASGQFLVIGVVMIMIGVVGHTARRRGRSDQISQKALAKATGETA